MHKILLNDTVHKINSDDTKPLDMLVTESTNKLDTKIGLPTDATNETVFGNFKALNSTIGTDEFKSLDKMFITKNVDFSKPFINTNNNISASTSKILGSFTSENIENFIDYKIATTSTGSGYLFISELSQPQSISSLESNNVFKIDVNYNRTQEGFNVFSTQINKTYYLHIVGYMYNSTFSIYGKLSEQGFNGTIKSIQSGIMQLGSDSNYKLINNSVNISPVNPYNCVISLMGDKRTVISTSSGEPNYFTQLIPTLLPNKLILNIPTSMFSRGNDEQVFWQVIEYYL